MGVNGINGIFAQASLQRDVARIKRDIEVSQFGAPSNSGDLVKINNLLFASGTTNSNPKPTLTSTTEHTKDFFKRPEVQILLAAESGEFPENDDKA